MHEVWRMSKLCLYFSGKATLIPQTKHQSYIVNAMLIERMHQVWVWLCACPPTSGKCLKKRQYIGTFLHLPLFQQPQLYSMNQSVSL